ncbi:MAG TPA: hypothetical protein VGM38_09330 [Pseudolysinimonas sp.]
MATRRPRVAPDRLPAPGAVVASARLTLILPDMPPAASISPAAGKVCGGHFGLLTTPPDPEANPPEVQRIAACGGGCQISEQDSHCAEVGVRVTTQPVWGEMLGAIR